MKAEELQIGDLLRVNRNGLCIKKGTVVTVRGIDGSNNFPEKGLYVVADCRPLDESQFQGGIWLDYLVPIPLTSEILEKNGWRSMMNGTGEFYLKKPLVDAAIVTKTITGFQMNHGPFSGLSIHYVHELQHALRICGITKEIQI